MLASGERDALRLELPANEIRGVQTLVLSTFELCGQALSPGRVAGVHKNFRGAFAQVRSAVLLDRGFIIANPFRSKPKTALRRSSSSTNSRSPSTRGWPRARLVAITPAFEPRSRMAPLHS